MAKNRKKPVTIEEYIKKQTYWRSGTAAIIKEVYEYLIDLRISHDATMGIIDKISSAARESYGD
ncbi:hypothetical protein LCGC14_0664100 [marine sediment metagenome]|uniref:Uncharacterized protein n=1 Tax=marine sediment metagenome TaxID=412755 RepID=A0A0F9QST2_9ZZZZ